MNESGLCDRQQAANSIWTATALSEFLEVRNEQISVAGVGVTF